VAREYEPTVGQWYEDLDNEETFQVLKVDEDQELIHIQYLDGDTDEIEADSWAELDVDLTVEPEGWSGSAAAVEDDDDDDEEIEDEDDDDWDDDLDDSEEN
jgi:hypothetical protein